MRVYTFGADLWDCEISDRMGLATLAEEPINFYRICRKNKMFLFRNFKTCFRRKNIRFLLFKMQSYEYTYYVSTHSQSWVQLGFYSLQNDGRRGTLANPRTVNYVRVIFPE